MIDMRKWKDLHVYYIAELDQLHLARPYGFYESFFKKSYTELKKEVKKRDKDIKVKKIAMYPAIYIGEFE